jgi:hypothetical protein
MVSRAFLVLLGVCARACRVSEEGMLVDVAPEPSIFQQFPLDCGVVKHLTGGYTWKSVAFKAYWRSNTGNHFVVRPERAKDYFGASKPGVRNARCVCVRLCLCACSSFLGLGRGGCCNAYVFS